MEFDYNYHVCAICDKEIIYNDYNTGKCLNGCCEYKVDPQGETVISIIFGENVFVIELYKDCFSNANVKEMLDKDLAKFLAEAAYWKENNRYLLKRLLNFEGETLTN